jgi:hypothetical protein
MAVLTAPIAAGILAHLRVAYLARHNPRTECTAIPEHSVVFAPAFLNLGTENGEFKADQSNTQLRDRLEECASRIALVVTQKAVSDTLSTKNYLADGTPVMQMHRDVESIDVKTLAALKAAIDRFDNLPTQIVLIAHPEQVDRAAMDLRALYGGSVLKVYPGPVLYPNLAKALIWHIKSPLGWTLDWFLIRSGTHPWASWIKLPLKVVGAVDEYPDEVRLAERIVSQEGKWVEQPPRQTAHHAAGADR